MTEAEEAVLHILERVRRHPDFRYLMLGTEGFDLLCRAEAARTRAPLEGVRATYHTSAGTREAQQPPRLTLLRELQDAVEGCAEFLENGTPVHPGSEVGNKLLAALTKVRNL